MLTTGERSALLQRLEHDALMTKIRFLNEDELVGRYSAGHGAVGIEGELCAREETLHLAVILSSDFPLTLPGIYVAFKDVQQPLPHVGSKNGLCYWSSEGLLLDYREPWSVLVESLEIATNVLSESTRGSNRADYIDELEYYWYSSGDAIPISCHVRADHVLRRLVAGVRGETYCWVADVGAEPTDFLAPVLGVPVRRARALYVPFDDSLLEEEPDLAALASPTHIHSFASRFLPRNNRRRLKECGGLSLDKPILVVFGIPRPSGGRALVGVAYRASPGHKLSSREPAPGGSRRILLMRNDRDYLLERGGANRLLGNKHVMVIGCGAVGGHLAMDLARAGVGRLTLVDHDIVTSDNLFRHPTGNLWLGAPKVQALATEVRMRVPYIEVRPDTRQLQSLLADSSLQFDADVMVVATGDQTLGLLFNDWLHARTHPAPTIFSWLEPYGLGGHALLTNTSREKTAGCLRCLFVRDPRDNRMYNRADFAGPGQRFAKTLSGCSGFYTPYADLDARRTAEQTARLAIEFLEGAVQAHPIRSWKGSASAFRNAGFHTSERYLLTEDQLQERQYSYVRSDCPTCGVSS